MVLVRILEIAFILQGTSTILQSTMLLLGVIFARVSGVLGPVLKVVLRPEGGITVIIFMTRVLFFTHDEPVFFVSEHLDHIVVVSQYREQVSFVVLLEFLVQLLNVIGLELILLLIIFV